MFKIKNNYAYTVWGTTASSGINDSTWIQQNMETGYKRKIVRLVESHQAKDMVDNTVSYEENKSNGVSSVEDLDEMIIIKGTQK